MFAQAIRCRKHLQTELALEHGTDCVGWMSEERCEVPNHVNKCKLTTRAVAALFAQTNILCAGISCSILQLVKPSPKVSSLLCPSARLLPHALLYVSPKHPHLTSSLPSILYRFQVTAVGQPTERSKSRTPREMSSSFGLVSFTLYIVLGVSGFNHSRLKRCILCLFCS